MRYTEASLIKKLDEYVNRDAVHILMVSIVQDRNYVIKKDIEGKQIPITDQNYVPKILELKKPKLILK